MNKKIEEYEILKEKIKDRLCIRDIMIDYGVDLRDHSSGLKGTACCPFHDDSNPSFSVDYEKGVYYCFGCHAKGDLFTFVGEKGGFSNFVETLNYLCSTYGISMPNRDGEISLEYEAEKIWALNKKRNIDNLVKQRERFDRIILEVYQKIKFCLELKNADYEFVKRALFPIYKEIDEIIESDKFDCQPLKDLSYKLDEKIYNLRRKNP